MSALEIGPQILAAVTHTVTVAARDSGGGDSGLVPAVVGGAIGVTITALARGLGIPSDARTHDAAIADQDEALRTWVADRHYRVGKDCRAVRANVVPDPGDRAKDGTPEDSFHAVAAATYQDQARQADIEIAALRGAALHEYRDQERRIRLERASILAAEGWPHRLWRRISGSPPRELCTPTEAIPILDSWRRQSQMSSGRPVWPDDATKRTLAGAISELTSSSP
jgi:hypothetical protein